MGTSTKFARSLFYVRSNYVVKKIKTPGLSHVSYLVGSGGKAAVIGPRRDCDIYLEIAGTEGLKITHIFETHRNEDLVSGAPILTGMTDAPVFHGPNAAGDVVYAEISGNGARFEIGQLILEVIETPALPA
ncbi:hypothetical protein A8B75_17445 [Sphingomonadales bacterium EhC05]|nr:hypothetical protein A8B75_17445 [Sphingomonadales bacterium EhC05]